MGNIFLLLIKKKVLLGIAFLTSIILFFNTLDIPFYSLLFYNVFAELPTDNYTRGTMVCDNLPFFLFFDFCIFFFHIDNLIICFNVDSFNLSFLGRTIELPGCE